MAASEITRLAPSPTGALHLGNARTFLINWLLARRNGWHIILRIEDLDGPRIKKEADQEAIEDLLWLGIDWDSGPIYQSPRGAHYQKALKQLLQTSQAYPCICSRSEAERAASAPHAEDGASVYPGTCQGRFATMAEAAAHSGRPPAIRFAVPPGVIELDDQFCGRRSWDVARELGDFVIAKADGQAAYQLAVVIDDADMGVTQVVRGDDLLDSTPRQMLLYRALEWADRIPRYTHLPLVRGADGRRLAKRHGDTRLSHFRRSGVTAGQILALLAGWCGMNNAQPRTAADLLPHFDLCHIPRNDIIYNQELP